MKNKIVILDDSVILYQHYIDDEAWEKVLGFPRGGLTYLIQNNNIKFYAYIDYFYRNCLMTMDLPIYIVDEDLGIDGEYSDIEEVTEILNRIFPALNGDIDLTPYLKKREAEALYQHIGDYFDGCNYNSDTKRIEFYAGEELACFIDATDFIKDGMVDSVSLIELSGDTYLHIVFNSDAGKEPIDIPLGDLFDIDNYYTKEESDDRFQPKGEYLTKESGDTFYQPIGEYLTKESGDTFYQPIGDYLTKESGDTIYQPIGDYALKSEIPSLEGYATETWVLNKGYINQLKTINNISLIGQGNIEIGSGGTIDAYTKQEADDRFQPKGNYVTEATVIQYITNLQEQINTIIEAVSGCCSEPEEIYRWITMTGPNDYICSGTTKYAKEKKQVSYDNGITWQDVVPAEYQRGAKLEEQSPDCGYEPVIEYRWITVSGEYVCSGTTKYNKEKKQYRVDGGAWQDTNPLETRRGSTVIELESTDCGYVPPMYRWYQAPASDYICSGTSKYYKEYYQVSYDGGSTWQNVSPEQTRMGALIETESTDCGYVPSETTKYLTFIPSENGTFKFTGKGTVPNTASYSLDSGSTWTSLESGANTPTITSGTKIMWKGSMIPADASSTFGVGTFSSTCNFVVEGNPMSLLYNDNFANQRSLSGKNHAFDGLFENCTKLTSIENIALPATTLSNECYKDMFKGCTNLAIVPSNLLVATTLTEGCYSGMFQGCTSLTSTVDLPSTKLANKCYSSMYSDCTNLASVKKLPSTSLAMWCYHMMFKGCSNLTTVPSDMLPATTLKDYCYGEMFYGCSKMETAPILPASTLVNACYNSMFENCSKLNYIKCIATSINATLATTAWVKGVQTNSGTFVKNANMNSWGVCDTSFYKGIPCNWTVQNA